MRCLLASSEGAAVIVGGAGRPDTLENVVSRATTHHERRYETFHPMNGYTLAQTVAMRIEGFHSPDRPRDCKSPLHTYSVY